MAEVVDQGRAACPNQCGELDAPYRIIETDEQDGSGEPIVKNVVNCPNCSKFETVLP